MSRKKDADFSFAGQATAELAEARLVKCLRMRKLLDPDYRLCGAAARWTMTKSALAGLCSYRARMEYSTVKTTSSGNSQRCSDAEPVLTVGRPLTERLRKSKLLKGRNLDDVEDQPEHDGGSQDCCQNSKR
jgi:hypothetical protein